LGFRYTKTTEDQLIKKTLLALALVPLLSGCGLLFVHGPPFGWQEAQDVDVLTRMSLLQPCTSSGALVGLDVLAIVMGVVGNVDPNAMGGTRSDEQLKYLLTGSLILGGGIGAIVGLNKVNDCRAFNARLMELGQGGASSLTSHEWLDELFPLPDLGVTGLDPVFGVPINQDH